MAIFRKIHTSFWSDPFIQDLDNDHRLFYLYLLTNEKTKQCGIYEISKKQMSFELGYSIDRVSKLLAYFIKLGKILYSETTKEVALKNWMKYNGSTSPKVVSCINSELKQVKDRVLIEYVNGIYTPSQEEEEQEEEKEQEEDLSMPFEKVWEMYGRFGNRKNSSEKWDGLKSKEKETIAQHVPIYIKNHKDNDKMDFVPHFTTYLNQERWKDDLPYKHFEVCSPQNSKNKASLSDD
jgi:hypothetical protein